MRTSTRKREGLPRGYTQVVEIECSRCGEERAAVGAPPFRDELGARIQESICQVCWDEWLFRQMQLINHHGLDVRKPEARGFLRKNVLAFLFGEGDADEIDTDQQGEVSW